MAEIVDRAAQDQHSGRMLAGRFCALLSAFLTFTATAAASAAVQLPGKHQALHAPAPEYPELARREGRTGSGVVLLSVDRQTGRVKNVAMTQSTRQRDLDEAALTAFRQWRFKPGSDEKVRLPVSFTLPSKGPIPFMGVVPGTADALLAATTPSGKRLSAAEVQQATVHAPPPPQNLSVVGYTSARTGVYLLTVGSDGSVSRVETLQSCGVLLADNTLKDNFKRWRFRPGSVAEVRVPARYHLR